MYCRYAKKHEQCPLDGGEFYCVLYQRFHCKLDSGHRMI